MKTDRNRIPLLITALAVLLVSFLFLIGEETKDRPEGEFKLDVFDHLESITYDARVRMSAEYLSTNDMAPTLGTIFIDDVAIERVNDGVYSRYMAPAWKGEKLGDLKFAVPWPRFMYGQIVRELKAQGVRAVGFDILFPELHIPSPQTDVHLDETNVLNSDQFFAQQMHDAGNVVLATEGGLLPNELFFDEAAAIASIASQNDYAVLRRVRAFGEYKIWHPKIVSMAKALQLNLRHVDLKTPGFVKIPFTLRVEEPDIPPYKIRLLPNGNLAFTADGELNPELDKNDMAPTNAPPYTLKRAWNLGLVLAAKQMGFDLDKAVVLDDRIILTAPEGFQRIIPTDHDHRFYIDWTLRNEDIQRRRTTVKFGQPLELLVRDADRNTGGTNIWENDFTNRIVIIGSSATGNNLTDMGATPLEQKTFLVTKHLNVANSLITGRFIHKTSNIATILLVMALGFLSGTITWRARVVRTSMYIAAISILYIVAAFWLYIQYRYWLPIVMPIFGGLLLPHFALVTYRVVFEQKEQRHIRAMFSKIVAPEIVNEVLKTEDLKLGGARRDITVYFADVRGFTEFTDRAHAEAMEYIKKHNLTPEQEKMYLDKQAGETMETVNLYLGIISGQITKHQGTLDKYIGDCVMAFWGAPIAQKEHALCAVRAAIDSQQAMYAKNKERAVENERRKIENLAREARGEEPLSMYPLLTLGSGINSGDCIVGMMGSIEHTSSYTVFGREVNLASRLEGVSGRGRIIISLRTAEDCKKFAPELAATFVELEAVKVKGIRDAVRIFEVPWKLPEHAGGTEMITASSVAPKTAAAAPVPAAAQSAPKPA